MYFKKKIFHFFLKNFLGFKKINFSNNEPLVSIIITSYNYSKYIVKTIDSIKKQSYKNWELIIIDDCSKDNSVKIIEKKLKKINNKTIFLKNKKNMGLIKSYKKAIEKTSGKYIAFIDSDDYWEKDNLFYKISVLEKFPKISIVYSNFFENEEKKYFNKIKSIPVFLSKKNKHHFFSLKIFSFSLVVTRKKFFENFDYSLPKKYGVLTDWWVYAQLLEKGSLAKIPLKLVFKREHDKNYSKKSFSTTNKKIFLTEYFEFREFLRKKLFKINFFYFYIIVFYWAINWRIRKLFLILFKNKKDFF